MRIDINVENTKSVEDEELFKVYVRVYDKDSYHRSIEETSLEARVRKMSSRPRTMNEFLDSLYLYDEWMLLLVEKHGGDEIFRLKLKAGLIEDYVPAPPKPKSKTLRELYKRGIIAREPNPRDMASHEEIEEWIENNPFPDNYESYTAEIPSKKKRKEVSEARRHLYDKRMKHLKNFRKGGSPVRSDIDFMGEYFLVKNKEAAKGKKKGKKNKKGGYRTVYEANGRVPRTLTDLMKGDYLDTQEEKELNQYNGILLSSGDVEDVELYHKLHEYGWNSYKLMKRGHVSKKVRKQFKARTSDKKKKGKKNKDGALDIRIGDEADAFINALLDEGGYDNFDEYERDMLDMTSSNIFR